jgi:hypothetical protein
VRLPMSAQTSYHKHFVKFLCLVLAAIKQLRSQTL